MGLNLKVQCTFLVVDFFGIVRLGLSFPCAVCNVQFTFYTLCTAGQCLAAFRPYYHPLPMLVLLYRVQCAAHSAQVVQCFVQGSVHYAQCFVQCLVRKVHCALRAISRQRCLVQKKCSCFNWCLPAGSTAKKISFSENLKRNLLLAVSILNPSFRKYESQKSGLYQIEHHLSPRPYQSYCVNSVRSSSHNQITTSTL